MSRYPDYQWRLYDGSWEITTPELRIIVHKHIHGAEGVYYVSCHEIGLSAPSTRTHLGRDVELAKKEALRVVEKMLLRMLTNLGKVK